ncbi:DUF4174 domain-containing protein [Sphingomonas morindae]|uniref:DUF4174 domain-containing protein n=1 Tax=Sphingomonas morindae TaxID=1541170 RepID=A0ABY4X6H3_9SPHN|nr:DUF4174 domain-containing protein [Sphingomonas morindae]USI72517.1 DUF4174 domain-containing protein [Sphingomonas morindae]
MPRLSPSLLLLPLILAGLLATSPARAANLRARPRLLIVSVAAADDPRLARQRAIMAAWRDGAAERDLRLVVLVGGRGRHPVPRGGFAVRLLGKDGHVALRSDAPLDADRLARVIDAMPMRRAGLR